VILDRSEIGGLVDRLRAPRSRISIHGRISLARENMLTGEWMSIIV
jgi:hypothetical protein